MNTRSFVAGLVIGITPGLVFAVVPHPVASAKTDVVYIGGTGTGTGLQGVFGTGGDGRSFAATFVPDIDQENDLVYNGSPVANPQDAVPLALAAVKATDDPTVVIGLSKGAQVAHGTEALDTRTDTRYVVVGDPDSDHGISRTFGLSPAQTVKTHDWDEVVAEYDGVGDMPDRPLNLLATANALAGWAFIHPNYGNGGDADPLTHLGEATTSSTKNPNGTTYTKHLIPTAHLPLLKPLRDTEWTLTRQTALTDAIEAAIRPAVDAGYSRNDRVDTKNGNKVEPKTTASTTASPSKTSSSDAAEAKETPSSPSAGAKNTTTKESSTDD